MQHTQAPPTIPHHAPPPLPIFINMVNIATLNLDAAHYISPEDDGDWWSNWTGIVVSLYVLLSPSFSILHIFSIFIFTVHYSYYVEHTLFWVP